jgi:hypothetical protein
VNLAGDERGASPTSFFLSFIRRPGGFFVNELRIHERMDLVDWTGTVREAV